MATQDLSLHDYYKIFRKNFKLIFVFTFVVSVLAIGISLILPLWYAGNAQLVQPQSQVLDVSNFQTKAMNLLGATDGPTTRILTILNSRSFKEKMCKKYDLVEIYNVKGMDKAVEKFGDHYSADVGDEGQIFISVFDKDQERVADMTNHAIFLLDSINNSLSSDYGSQERIFIENQLNAALDSLYTLEDELLVFMKTNNVLSADNQIASEVEYATELKYQIMLKETEINMLRRSKQNRHMLESEELILEKMKEQYSDMFRPGNDLFLDLNKAPEIQLFAQKMERNIQYFNEVLLFIGPLYEQAKITEAKKIPTFEVLDYAHRPDRKAKPKRAIIVISAFMFALLSSGVYALLKETQDNDLND